jgi:hypothetical protein
MSSDLRVLWGIPRASAAVRPSKQHQQAGPVWARGSLGPIGVDEAQHRSERTDLVCYECDQSVQYTRAHDRVVGGVTYPVRAFFSHVGASCGTHGGGEGALHKASKDVRGVAYYDACRICKAKVRIAIPGVRMDGERNVTLGGVTWRPDVSYVDASSGNLVGAVEICHTHATSDDKARAYTQAGLPWVEVDAEEHLRASAAGAAGEVRVLRSSFDVTDRVCGSCIIAEEERLRVESVERMRLSRAEALELKVDNDRKATALRHKMEALPDNEREIVADFMDWYKETKQRDAPAALVEKVDDANCILGFGKHRGCHVRRVFDADPSYIFWMVQKSSVVLHPEMRVEVLNLIDGLCSVCMEETGYTVEEAVWKTMCRRCYAKKRRL